MNFKAPMLIILKLTVVLLLAFCSAPKAVSVLTFDKYDEKTDQTIYSKHPYGSLSLQGQWTKTFYNQTSRQQSFQNKDSLTTALSINRISSFPFYTSGMTSNQFVKAMYDWDAAYWIERLNGSAKILDQDTVNHFIVWQIEADNKEYQLTNVYLFGSENGIVFTVQAPANRMTKEQMADFVRAVYKNKRVGNCCN